MLGSRTDASSVTDASTATDPSVTEPSILDSIEAAATDATDTTDEDEFATSDYDTASTASTSVTSSVYQHSFENGRRYHQYRHGRYPIPNDDIEQNRDNMKHVMMLELTDGKLFFAPIGSHPHKILDLGTGTGAWAIDVADAYPSAEVTAVDLSPIQTAWVPPNLKFWVDDIEDEWLHGNNFDLVHLRHIVPWMKRMDLLIGRIYENLKPGGWVEIQEFDGRVVSDDNSLPADSSLVKFFDLAEIAVKNFGMTFRACTTLQEPLEKAGFVNVTKVVLKIPIGAWAKDKRMRLIGMYLQTAVSDMFSAMAAKPFRSLDMQPVEIEVLLATARNEMKDPMIHAYECFYFWMGQKPASP